MSEFNSVPPMSEESVDTSKHKWDDSLKSTSSQFPSQEFLSPQVRNDLNVWGLVGGVMILILLVPPLLLIFVPSLPLRWALIFIPLALAVLFLVVAFLPNSSKE
ncbi:hypothetical protein KRX54_07475 [Actinomycetaceae bacterium TAE3-ERU4]|nr:hypothetical protein [Actinomycetaceae bacterium TAE3-ERU4]